MSDLFPRKEDNLQWDFTSSLAGPSNTTFDLSSLGWPSLEPDGSIPGILGHGLYNSALDYPEEGTRADINRRTVSEVSNADSAQRTRKRSKLRNTSATDLSDQSALDRRRTQVRLAQRAYRNREKTLVSTLRKDVDDLKDRLRGMQTVSDNWFEFISSLPTLSNDHKRKVWSLRTSEASYRLPASLTSAEVDSEITTITSYLGTKPSINQAAVSDKFSPQSLADSTYGMASDGLATKRPRAFVGREAPKDLSPNFRILLGPSKYFRNDQLDFSVRLRIDALKGAHRLIATSDTPYATLLDVFRQCIFISTRQEIKSRLEILIQETSGSDALPRRPLEVDKASEQFPPLVYPADVEDEEEERGTKGDRYIDPDGIREYLSEKGLNVDSGESYAEFSPPRGGSDTSSSNRRTIFEEVCHSQRVKVSIIKLHRELLSRMVCRWIGPGILASKIDEALQSTLLASAST